MKEKIKKLLIEHERLYWLIIIGLSVFALALSTILLGKAEKAHAAESATSITVKCNSSVYEIPLEGYKYYFVAYDTEGYAKVYISNAPLEGYLQGANLYLSGTGGDVITYGVASNNEAYLETRSLYDTSKASFGVANFENHESNYDFYDVNTGAILYTANSAPNSVELTYSYIVNAPYIAFDSLRIEGAADTGVFSSSLYFAYDWRYKGYISGQPMDAEEYKLKYTLTVCLPSADYICTVGSEYSFWEFLRDDIGKCIADWKKNCLYDNDKTDRFTLTFERELYLYEDETFHINIDSSDIYDAICEQYGESYFRKYEVSLDLEDSMFGWLRFFGLKEYFPTAEEKWEQMFLPYVMSFTHIENMGSLLYSRIDDTTVYYGRYVLDSFMTDGSCVTAEVCEDIYEMDDDALVDTISEKMEKAYNDALESVSERVKTLQDEINNLTIGDNAYSDLSASDIWDYAKSTANGLMSSMSWISSLGLLVTKIFGFIPGISENIIMPVFIICIITAVVSFIRGK